MIIIMGAAGSGKTTQGQLLATRLQCPWLSTSQLLRQHLADSQTHLLETGNLIDDSVLLPILETELTKFHANSRELVLDGAPRTAAQAKWLVDRTQTGQIMFTSVIYLKLDKAGSQQRLIKRARADDTQSAIQQRLEDYDKNIDDILAFFQNQGLTAHEVDGSGTVEEVTQRINQTLG